MKSISNLSVALIIAAAIVLMGNVLSCGLSTLSAATMGFMGTSTLGMRTKLLYGLSGMLFALGVGLAVVSISIERKKNQ